MGLGGTFAYDDFMSQYYLLLFHLHHDVPLGQKWAEFERDGEPYGAVLDLPSGRVYEFPIKLSPFNEYVATVIEERLKMELISARWAMGWFGNRWVGPPTPPPPTDPAGDKEG